MLEGAHMFARLDHSSENPLVPEKKMQGIKLPGERPRFRGTRERELRVPR